jgi:predicted nucleic acid-binding protein
MGFLRLLTNRHVMKDEVVTPDRAWQTYAAFRSDRRVDYLAEPAALSEIWRDFTPRQTESPNLWTDAYVCAFAAAADLRLATFDGKIPQRADAATILLSSAH